MSAFHSKSPVSPHVSSVVPTTNLTYKPNKGIFKVITLCLIKTLIITLCTLTFQTQTYAAQIQTSGGTYSLAEQEHNRTRRGANLFGLFASAVGTAVKTKLKELKSTVQRKGKELQNTITRPLQQAVDNTVQTVVAQAAQSATQAVQSQPVQAQVQQLTSTATSAVTTLANTVLDDLLGRAKETAKTVGYSLLGVLAAALTGFTIFAIVKWGR